MSSVSLTSTVPPFANFAYRNYDLVLNLLPEIRRDKTSEFGLVSGFSSEASTTLREALLRYFGVISKWVEETAQEVSNPVVWLREGIQFILASPVLLLQWVGLVSATTTRRVRQSGLVKVLSGLTALITVISALVEAVVGWDQFTKILSAWWSAW